MFCIEGCGITSRIFLVSSYGCGHGRMRFCVNAFAVDAGSPYADAGVTATINPYASFANSSDATAGVAFSQHSCACIAHTVNASTNMGGLS